VAWISPQLHRVDNRDGQEDQGKPLVPGLQLADVPPDQVGEFGLVILVEQVGY